MTKTVRICHNGLCGECYACRLSIACRWLAEAEAEHEQIVELLRKVFTITEDALPPNIVAEVEKVLQNQTLVGPAEPETN